MTTICQMLLLIMLPFQSGATVNDFKAKVSINYQRVPAATLITELGKQAGINFIFDLDQIKVIELKNVHYQNKELGIVLQDLNRNSALIFNPVNSNSIAVSVNKKKNTSAHKAQQPGRIAGRIVDDKSGPLPGASIKLVELNKVISSSIDGSYQFTVPSGTYIIEVSYISFQTKRITDVVVKAGQLVKLDIVLNVASSALKEVVVTSSYKKESVNSLYAQQKNSASMTDGISAEQISRTPDNNLGQVIRRISGVTAIDNRYVVVRGLSERYNQAMLDGVVIPSTDMNRRNFAFDVVPQELVSSVVVNKTATPDVSSEFAGGQVIINTLDIPEENFISFSIGGGYNSRSTGKDFVQLGRRGKYDYFGFNQRSSKVPDNIQSWFQKTGSEPLPTLATHGFDAIEQSKRFSSQELAVYHHTTAPNQNYRFSFGHVTDLNKELKFGIVAGLTYRNSQEINPFETIRASGLDGNGDYIDSAERKGSGHIYRFNTSLGGVLNAGIKGEKFKIGLKNYYSRIFNNNTQDAFRYNATDDERFREIYALPEVTAVLQNRLEGNHNLSRKGLKLDWSGAMTNITQQIRDRRRTRYRLTTKMAGTEYYQTPNIFSFGNNSNDYDHRLWTDVKESDYNWALSLAHPFNLLNDKSLVKVGYTGWYKKRDLDATQLNMVTAAAKPDFNRLYEDVMSPGNIGSAEGQAIYYVPGQKNGEQFSGSSRYSAGYVMLDQRFFQTLRLVYGLRAENFNLQNAQKAFERDPSSVSTGNIRFNPFVTGEKNWRFLPSANLTYSLTDKMNVRAAWSQTMVRPDFRETSYFELYDPTLDAFISGWNVRSSRIHNYDLRYEWYPSSGEIVSLTAFYKKFDDPLELVRQSVSGSGKSIYLRFENQKEAHTRGLEMEIRKSLDFIADKQWLKDLSIFGNGTLMESEVTGLNYLVKPLGEDQWELEQQEVTLKRPLYGQTPWIINAGINYNSKSMGANIVYNRTGYRANSIDFQPNSIEYENGRNAIDLQLSTRLMKQRAEIKLNIANLLDNETFYYRNSTAYSQDGVPGEFKWSLTNGTNAYEKDKGDQVTYRVKYGRTANLSFSYKF